MGKMIMAEMYYLKFPKVKTKIHRFQLVVKEYFDALVMVFT